MEKRKYCNFNVRVTKAYVDDETGLKHIEAIASDTGIDWYMERFSERAIDDMVMYSRQRKEKKPNEGLVDLRETHWDTFGIGFADDGEKIDNPKTSLPSFKVNLALKSGVWQADELYDDVKNNVADKQLSVGGYIPDWETDYDYENETFTNDDGEEIEVTVGVIKRFILEHIAVTPPDGAANPRTEFLSAKSKDPNAYKYGYVYRSAMSPEYQKKFAGEEPVEESNRESFIKGIVGEVKSIVKEVFTETMFEREEQMKVVEKGKKLVEDLKKLVEENPEDFADIAKSLGVSFVSESEEEHETLTEEKVQSVVKTKLDSITEEFEAKLEEVRKSIPEMPEIPEIPEDKSEVIKSLEEKVAELETRLKAIEEQAPETQDEPEQHDNEDEETEVEDEVTEPDPDDDLAAWR
jgi:hypothetical protein